MTNHSAAPAAPHSADALKQQSRAEFEAHIRAKAESEEYATLILQRNGLDEYSTVWVQAEWNGWQAAWNRRPTPASDLCADLNAERINTTPASPGLDNEAAARLRKQAEEAKKVRGVVALSPEDAFALLDRVECAEADRDQANKDCVMWIRACNEANQRAEAAAGAVPEGVTFRADRVIASLDFALTGIHGKDAVRLILTHRHGSHDIAMHREAASFIKGALDRAAAPPAQGLPAAPKKPYLSKFATLEEYQAAMREYQANTPPAAAPSEPVARLLHWNGPKHMSVPHGGICARTFAEFPKGAGENGGYWKEGAPLVLATPPAQDAGTGELIPCAYRIGPIELRGVKIEEAGQMEGPALWAVRRSGSCLNKSGEWEYEPLPSSRDDAFLARCRFATPDEAFRAIANSGRTE